MLRDNSDVLHGGAGAWPKLLSHGGEYRAPQPNGGSEFRQFSGVWMFQGWREQHPDSAVHTTGPHGCPYSVGTFQYWQINPPTKSSGSSYNITYWVGGEAKADQSVCFQAWSYNNVGVSFQGTQSMCKVNAVYNAALPALTVPAYGATTVLGYFAVLAPYVQPLGTRWSEVAWPYN